MKCIICFNNAQPGDEIRSTKCGHCFHKDCIERWLSTKASCPSCRRSVNSPLLELFVDFDDATANQQVDSLSLVYRVNDRLKEKLKKVEKELSKVKKDLNDERNRRHSERKSTSRTTMSVSSSLQYPWGQQQQNNTASVPSQSAYHECIYRSFRSYFNIENSAEFEL